MTLDPKLIDELKSLNKVLIADGYGDKDNLIPELDRAIAALAALPQAEPVAWQGVAPDGSTDITRKRNVADGWERANWIVRALVPAYPTPAEPSPATGVRVKALRWQMENVDGTIWTGVAPMSGQYLVKHTGKQWECIRGMLLVGAFGTRDEAKAAGQSDFEARIRSSLGEQS